MRKNYRARTTRLALLLCLLIVAIEPVPAAPVHPYEAASTGYFRDQDTLPGAFQLFQQSPEGKGGF